MPKISWMTSTTGVLLFDSGYTTNVSTERPSCLMVTHSRWRGDFVSAALAQSCAEAICATHRISSEIRAMRLMDWSLPQRTGLAGRGLESVGASYTRGILMPRRKDRKPEQRIASSMHALTH